MPPVRKKGKAEVQSPTSSIRSTRSSAESPRTTTPRSSPRAQSAKTVTSGNKPSDSSPKSQQSASTSHAKNSLSPRQSASCEKNVSIFVTAKTTRSSPRKIMETQIASSQSKKEKNSDKEKTIVTDASDKNEAVTPRSRGRPRKHSISNEVPLTGTTIQIEDKQFVSDTQEVDMKTQIASSQSKKEKNSDKEKTIVTDASDKNEAVTPRSRGRPRKHSISSEVPLTGTTTQTEDKQFVSDTQDVDKLKLVNEEKHSEDSCKEILITSPVTSEISKKGDSTQKQEEDITKMTDGDNLTDSKQDKKKISEEEADDSVDNLTDSKESSSQTNTAALVDKTAAENITHVNEPLHEEFESLKTTSESKTLPASKSNFSMTTSGTQTKIQPVKRKMSPLPVEPPDKKSKIESPSAMMSPRKSSRQVKMSRWFEDMEVSFGKDKKQKKTHDVTVTKSDKKRKTPAKTITKHVTKLSVVVNPSAKTNKDTVKGSELYRESELGKTQERSISGTTFQESSSSNTKPVQSKPLTVVQSNSVREVQSKAVTAVESVSMMEVQSESVTGVQSESVTAVQSESVAEVQSESVTEVQSKAVTAVESVSMMEVQSEYVMGVQSESVTEVQSESVTEVQSESVTGVQSESVTEVPSESVTEVQGESVTEVQSESVTGVQSESVTVTSIPMEVEPAFIETVETLTKEDRENISLPGSEKDISTIEVEIRQLSTTEADALSNSIEVDSSLVNAEVTESLLTVVKQTESADVQTATETEDNTDRHINDGQIEGNKCKPSSEGETSVYSNLTYTRVSPEEVNADPLLKTISVDIQTEPSNTQSKKQEFVIVRLPEGTPIQPESIIDKKKMSEEDGVQCEVNLAEGTFSCTECSYITNKKTNWYKHKKKHMGVKPYTCDVCDYKSATSSNLKRHMGIHRDVRKHACERCGSMFRQKIHLERHIKYKHEEKSVQCPLCDYVCANENPDLKVHIKRRHNRTTELASSEMFTCEECGLIAVSKKDYRQHVKFHRKGPELKLFCELCSFVTDCESRMNRHMMIHTKEKPYQCGMCEYRGTQREHVIRHMKSQHQVDIPDKIQSTSEGKTGEDSEGKLSEDNLSNHSTPSSSDPDKKYDKADFSTRDKIFACNHCTMKFAKLINLYKHLHTQHKTIMPNSLEEFSCVVCEFKTTSKKNLLVHMRKHNLLDQSPPTHVYSCVLCNYVNPKRRNLFQHMKKKHKIEIVMKDDGSANCFIAENSNLTGEGRNENLMTVGDVVTASTSDTQFQFSSGTVQRLVSINDLANAIALPQNTDGVVYIDQTNGAKAVTEMDLADLQVESINVQHEAAEAIQGLQALAEQSERHVLETPINMDALSGITETSEEIGEQILTEQVVEEPQVLEESQLVEEVSQTECNVELPEEAVSTDDDDRPSIQLSSDQLMNLSSGDYVEINGEMYKVEFSTEPSSS